MDKQVMNEEELALYLRIPVTTVRRLRNSGMPVRFIGTSENRDSRYLLDEIVDWLKTRPEVLAKKKKKS